VEIVGGRRFHNGAFEQTPIVFPTATSNMQIFNVPPSDLVRGGISSVTYVPSLGVIEGGTYYKVVVSTGADHAVVWNGTPNSAVDVHVASHTDQIGTQSSITGVSAAPGGFQASGYVTSSGRFLAAMWRGATPQTAQVTLLHDFSRMEESKAMGAYVFNGVAKQVGYTSGTLIPSRAIVWSGSAASAVDLTPPGFFSAAINAGNGDGAQEILCGLSSSNGADTLPTVWFGTGGAFSTLNTTAQLNKGSVEYCSQTSGAGYLTFGGGAVTHAALWDLSTRNVIDLHQFLPPDFQNGYSDAFYVDAVGNVYGQAQTGGGTLPVPVVWMVPEPGSLSFGLSACLWIWRRRRQKVG
jgi:hypothetical protein